MSDINKLLEIANYLEINQIVSDLQSIDSRSRQESAMLTLPLVGEFSSGKTTLINALTDSKKLETATKPTTATIYEVHFGCDKCHAKVLDKEGVLFDVEDIANLKNDQLADAIAVTVFDTSDKVPSTTILVDTPGLSSPDPKHKLTLVNFLPKADGLLLVVDINQQITKSLTDFVEDMKLSKRPIFLVLTKGDTKSAAEIDAVRKNISENCKIPIKNTVVVSAARGDLDEFYSLLSNIEKEKKTIIAQVDSQRTKMISDVLSKHIEELLKASSSDDELNESIRRCQYELDKVNRNIDRLVDSLSDDIEEQSRQTTRQFEDAIFAKLNSLVTGSSNNFDMDAVSAINSTTALLTNDYKGKIQELLRNKARSQKNSDNEVPLTSLESLDLSSVHVDGLSYNLELNTMGHEYDGMIKVGVIAAAAIGTAVAVASTGGTAAGALAEAATLDSAIDIADTVTDVGSIVSNSKTANRIENAVSLVKSSSEQYNNLSDANQQIGQQAGQDKGLIDSMVGFVTDKLMSKPQRVHAVRNYIEGTLMPEFKMRLSMVTSSLITTIRESLHSEASTVIQQKTNSLNKLKDELREKKELFNQRMDQLREYQTVLLTL